MKRTTTQSMHTIFEPLYRLEIQASACELEIMHSKVFRRLKHLHHFGAGALISPVVHSRLEHSIGVWALTAHFLPAEHELRLAALVHDVGHYPFSHALEKPLKLDHHLHTEELIATGELSAILKRHQVNPQQIISVLAADTPLTGCGNCLGIDHIDSFMRDNVMQGFIPDLPSQLVQKLSLASHGIQTDEKTAMTLIDLIVHDHETFLNPYYLAVDQLLSTAVSHYIDETGFDPSSLRQMIDFEILQLLQQSRSEQVQEIVEMILYEPHRIMMLEHNTVGGQEVISDTARPGSNEHDQRRRSLQVGVRKVYKKTPLVAGEPFIENNTEAYRKLKTLDELKATYLFTY